MVPSRHTLLRILAALIGAILTLSVGCLDECPGDPDKNAAGFCGCGIADTASDADGTPDCSDQCPDDPNKTEPGKCGCGRPETDSDADGTPDCIDGCPSDPAKTTPGVCGCGVPDIDSDQDGTPDCIDGCINDPAKIAAGACGCGNPDSDANENGIPDCNESPGPTLIGIVISPRTISFTSVSEFRQLQVIGHYSDYSTQELTAASKGTTYQSSDTSVATVSADGLVRPLADGQATITATNGGFTDTADLSALLIPPAPQAIVSATMTRDSSVTVSGSAPGSATVSIVGGVAIVETAVTGGAFSAAVPLQINRVNRLFVTGISAAGTASAPTTVAVVQDADPPSLFIDFPAASAQITTATTDVTGRVSDALSGFMGLTVMVNGVSAIVDVGIGTNGTFFATGVLLTVGGPMQITATASDAVGNTTTKQIAVTHFEIPPNTPRMVVVSGNGQTGMAGAPLADPIVVQLTQADGSPFAGKIVTFNVTRSDGRLTTDGKGEGSLMLQVRTDAAGLARAFWRLGTDAGNGNNRIEATSTSVAGTVAFSASGTPMPPSQINIGTGNNQRGEVGAPAPEPLRAWVSDSCNGIKDMPVTFTVTAGDGKVNGQEAVTVNTSRTGHAEVNFTLGPNAGNNLVEANFLGNINGPATFVVFGVVRDPDQPTSFTGLVMDNASQPIQGVTCTLAVIGQAPLMATTDSQGQFRMDNVVGSGFADLFVDGATATAVGGQSVPSNSFPSLTYEPVLIPNAVNALSMPVLLPPLNPNNAKTYNGTQSTNLELTCEGMEGLKMIVKAGTTITLLDGKKIGPNNLGTVALSLNQVHHDSVPMPIPDGAAPPFTWTLQPGGAKFDKPVEIVYPNMSALPAGAISYFLSFNHDTGRFEIIGSGHVVADGSTIVCDTGVGISNAGWGCNCPPYAVTASCEKCNVTILSGFPTTEKICKPVTFRARGRPQPGTYSWLSTDGSPMTGSGETFTTQWSTPGQKSIRVRWEGPGDCLAFSERSIRVEVNTCANKPEPYTTVGPWAKGFSGGASADTIFGAVRISYEFCRDPETGDWRIDVTGFEQTGLMNGGLCGAKPPTGCSHGMTCAVEPTIGPKGNVTAENYQEVLASLRGYLGRGRGCWHLAAATQVHELYHREVDAPRLADPWLQFVTNELESFRVPANDGCDGASRELNKKLDEVTEELKIGLQRDLDDFEKEHTTNANDGAYQGAQDVLTHFANLIERYACEQNWKPCSP